jgi:lipid II:glycine glycyltransferase (peptidoglycan interpeptide bridge formation enzyme)
MVGKYFYVPRGPVLEILNPKSQIPSMQELVDLAKKEKAGWIRMEPATEKLLAQIKKSTRHKIVPAPHDVQPKEIFILDIAKAEDQLLSEMKSKTRYNIKLAEKKGVRVFVSREEKHLDHFFELVEITAKRQGVVFHTKDYYQKMLATIPEENIKIFCAEVDGGIVAANLVLFFGDTVTYLHGASDDRFRHVMAPYLLQWRQIQAAQKYGARKYDFGGVKTKSEENNWAGITRFKQSFSPGVEAIEFPGAFDIVIDHRLYYTYQSLQYIKTIKTKTCLFFRNVLG